MKKAPFLFIVLLFFAFTFTNAQESPQPDTKSTIKIEGKGNVRIAPDLAVMSMTVKATDMDFNRAIKKLNEKTNRLNKKLLNAGFNKEEIKTSQLNVQENGKWRNGEYVDSGYVASQFIELKFKRDPQRMARLMDAFAEEKGAEALFHFGFALSDETRQMANEELIRKAIADARNKATIISKASGVKLGNVKNIVYGKSDNQSGPMYKEAMQMSIRGTADQGMPDIEAQEIEMTDIITIYWEIL